MSTGKSDCIVSFPFFIVATRSTFAEFTSAAWPEIFVGYRHNAWTAHVLCCISTPARRNDNMSLRVLACTQHIRRNSTD